MRTRLLMLAMAASLILGTSLSASAAEPSASPAPGGPLPACPNPHGGGLCAGTLERGTHETTLFLTPFTYRVRRGWSNFVDRPGDFQLVPPGVDLQGATSRRDDYLGVYQGVTVADCMWNPEPGVGTSPERIVAALAQNDGIVVSKPVRVEVGGLHGLRIDVAASDVAGEDCVAIITGNGYGPANLFRQFGDRDAVIRLYLLELGETNIVIEVGHYSSSPWSFKDFHKLIESIDFALPDE